MEIQFTKHAVRRMGERGISEDEVYSIFDSPVLVLERMEKIIIGKTRHGRFLTLVFDSSGKRLLTLWPSNRSQRKLYQEKKQEIYEKTDSDFQK